MMPSYMKGPSLCPKTAKKDAVTDKRTKDTLLNAFPSGCFSSASLLPIKNDKHIWVEMGGMINDDNDDL